MSKIYQDEKGLYAKVGGWIARPVDGQTEFTINDNPQGKHFGGSTLIGMGKAPGRGKYQEYWRTSGCYIAGPNVQSTQPITPSFAQYMADVGLLTTE